MSGASDVVHHDGVEALALELAAAALHGARRRARPRSPRASGRGGGAPASAASTSVVGSSSIASPSRPVFEILESSARAGPEVGHGRGHQQHVGVRELRARGGLELGGALHVDVRGSRAGAASATLAAISVTSAPRRAASSASARPMRPEERLPT